MSRSNPGPLGFAILVACMLPGCNGIDLSNSGDAIVVKNSLTGVALLAVAGLVLAGLGVTFFVLSFEARWRPTTTSRSKSPTPLQKTAGILGGMALTIAGAAILIIGVPYRLLAHITIGPDRVTLRDSVLWFANSERILMYDSIIFVGREDLFTLKKRNQKEKLTIELRDGEKIEMEMGPLELAAYQHLIHRHHAFLAMKRASGAGVAAATRSSNGSVDPERAPDQQETGSATSTGNQDSQPPSDRLEPEADPVVRRPITIPLPPSATRIDASTPIDEGDKLLACYANQWEPVTVMKVNDDGTLQCRWDRWVGFTYKMLRNDLVQGELPSAATDRSAMAAPNHKFGGTINEEDRPAPLTPTIVKRYPITIPIPRHAELVQPDTYLVPGTKLGACYAGKWESVTVVQVHDDGAVRCNWDNWTSFTYDMSREDLIIEKTVLAKLEAAQQQESPAPREWSDVSGKFRVTAAYVDSKEGYVKLQKLDGTELSVLISRLSQQDRELISRLEKRD